VEVVEKREYLFRRRFDRCRALDAERIRFGRGINEKSGDQNNDYNADFLP
jgi:hypothetical protein